MSHKHSVLDHDTHFIIDPATRAITTSSEKLHVMQYDHNSERLTFEMPRFIEGHDMSLCNRVEAHFLNIDTKTKDQITGHRELEDFRVSEEDENKVAVSWLISKGATKLGGKLNFLLNFRCVENDVETYAWHTDFFTNYNVKSGLDAAALFESEYVDVIEQWKASVMQHFTDDLTAWKEHAQAEVKAEVSREIAVERARIDNIVALKEGSTTGDAELADIHIGANGEKYTSAGEAVREQIKKVDSKIVDINYMEAWVEGGYTNKSGVFVENSSFSDSVKIPCLPDEVFTISVNFPNGINASAVLSTFVFYDSHGEYISYVSTYEADNGLTTDMIYEIDEANRNATYTLTIPNDGSIRYFTTYANNIYWERGMFKCTCGASKNYKLNGLMPISAIYFDEKIPEKYIEATTDTGKQWNGKKWFAFGTSITDTSSINVETGEVVGKYVPYLVEYSGLNVVNYGIAGGCIGSGGIHGGTSSILNKILSTNLSKAELITIEGFVNDFACAVSIGEIGDTESTTVCGALYQAIKYCLENSSATVVLLTESYGKEYTLTSTGNTANYSIDKKNSLGLIQKDYNDAIVKMGAYMGVPVIDCGANSHINNFHPEYIADQIHHTELGGRQYAKTIWSELKNIIQLETE